jgi:hypothetical protein
VRKGQAWALDNTGQKIGCGDSDEIGEYEIEKNEELGDIYYEVRSGTDPLLFAREVTGMRLNFGLPGSSWKIMGTVLMVLTLGLIVQPTVYFKKRVYGELPESPKLVEFVSIKK